METPPRRGETEEVFDVALSGVRKTLGYWNAMKFPLYVYTAVSVVSYTPPRGLHIPRPRRPVRLGIIPRLVKDMIPMSPDALAPEHLWEPQAGMHVLLADDVVSVFGLADDEFAELPCALATEKNSWMMLERRGWRNLPGVRYP
jgi:hypothetical protein